MDGGHDCHTGGEDVGHGDVGHRVAGMVADVARGQLGFGRVLHKLVGAHFLLDHHSQGGDTGGCRRAGGRESRLVGAVGGRGGT